MTPGQKIRLQQLTHVSNDVAKVRAALNDKSKEDIAELLTCLKRARKELDIMIAKIEILLHYD